LVIEVVVVIVATRNPDSDQSKASCLMLKIGTKQIRDVAADGVAIIIGSQPVRFLDRPHHAAGVDTRAAAST
jgi:hypothetical protein